MAPYQSWGGGGFWARLCFLAGLQKICPNPCFYLSGGFVWFWFYLSSHGGEGFPSYPAVFRVSQPIPLRGRDLPNHPPPPPPPGFYESFVVSSNIGVSLPPLPFGEVRVGISGRSWALFAETQLHLANNFGLISNFTPPPPLISNLPPPLLHHHSLVKTQNHTYCFFFFILWQNKFKKTTNP